MNLELQESTERGSLKKTTTLDEALSLKLNPIIDLLNGHVQKVYEDFNGALLKQIKETERVERDTVKMIEVLWGIVNQANARALAMETVLVKNGMDTEELNQEIRAVEAMMKNNNMKSVKLDDVSKGLGLTPSS